MNSSKPPQKLNQNELAACKTLAFPEKGGACESMRLSPCVLVQPDGWARGEREGYGEPCDVTSLSLSRFPRKKDNHQCAIITMHNNRVDLVGVVRPAIQLAEVVDVLQVPITGGEDVGLRRRRAVVLLAERVELRI